MEREVASFEKGAVCCAWNYCGQRIAVGHIDGSVSIHDSHDYPAAPSSSSKWKAHSSCVVKVVWTPPECGDAIACICEDGKFSLWEEIDEDTQCPTWKLCKLFESSGSHVLELQFGIFVTNLKMVAAYSDGHVKVYELMDPLNLDKWQLQATLQLQKGEDDTVEGDGAGPNTSGKSDTGDGGSMALALQTEMRLNVLLTFLLEGMPIRFSRVNIGCAH